MPPPKKRKRTERYTALGDRRLATGRAPNEEFVDRAHDLMKVDPTEPVSSGKGFYDAYSPEGLRSSAADAPKYSDTSRGRAGDIQRAIDILLREDPEGEDARDAAANEHAHANDMDFDETSSRRVDFPDQDEYKQIPMTKRRPDEGPMRAKYNVIPKQIESRKKPKKKGLKTRGAL